MKSKILAGLYWTPLGYFVESCLVPGTLNQEYAGHTEAEGRKLFQKQLLLTAPNYEVEIWKDSLDVFTPWFMPIPYEEPEPDPEPMFMFLDVDEFEDLEDFFDNL